MTSAEIKKDSWYSSPEDAAVFKEATAKVIPILYPELNNAIAQLGDSAFLELSVAKAKVLTGVDFDPNKKIILSRGLVYAYDPSGFVLYSNGDAFWIRHSALSHSIKKSKCPVVISVDRLPNKIFVSCSVAE